mmetsp:Transcript_55363/g.125815  ORF Transcript_55363/g.125815 Transcript_55363/m.125815 type:complete len:194 (-) Transcript_55363:418-999(-)
MHAAPRSSFCPSRTATPTLVVPALSVPSRVLPRDHDGELKNFGLKAGRIADDAAMGHCLADSLLVSDGRFNGSDARSRFRHWWNSGYNNAFRNDSTCDCSSVGRSRWIHYQVDLRMPPGRAPAPGLHLGHLGQRKWLDHAARPRGGLFLRGPQGGPGGGRAVGFDHAPGPPRRRVLRLLRPRHRARHPPSRQR